MTPMFFVLAWAYFRHPDQIATTPLGRSFSAIPVTIFGFRALAEPIFGNMRTFESWFFFVLCSIVAAVFAVPAWRGARVTPSSNDVKCAIGPALEQLGGGTAQP